MTMSVGIWLLAWLPSASCTSWPLYTVTASQLKLRTAQQVCSLCAVLDLLLASALMAVRAGLGAVVQHLLLRYDAP